MAWIPPRELLLGPVHTPALLLPLAAVLGLALAWWLQQPRSGAAALDLLIPLSLSAIYPHPLASTLLSGWQLPRATRAFARQGLQVHPLAAEPPLTAPERNRLALREAAATLLYRLQGRK